MKTVELMVRINASVPEDTDVESLCIDVDVKNIRIAELSSGYVVANSIKGAKVNEYETMDVQELKPS